MVKPTEPGDGTLEADSESRVRYRAVTTQVKVPLEVRTLKLVLLNPLLKEREVVDALRSTDDLAVTLRREEVGARGHAQHEPAEDSSDYLRRWDVRRRATLRRVYVLVDGRHGPKDNDLTVMNELDKAAVSYQVVLTKSDKPLKKDLDKVIAATEAAIAKRPAAHPRVILTSSLKGEGLRELRTEIAMLLES